MRWRRGLLIAIGTIAIAPVLTVGGYLAWGHFVDSPRYAQRYFAGLFPVEAVLGSRKWHSGTHPEGGTAFGCTYAIARVGEPAPVFPATRHARDWQMTWGGDWAETPLRPQLRRADIVDACADLLPEDLAGELRRIRDEPGHFAAQRSVDTVYLYSPGLRLAALVRYGD